MESEFFENDYKNKVVFYWIARFCIKNRNKIKTIALKEDWVLQDWQMMFLPIFEKLLYPKKINSCQLNDEKSSNENFEIFLDNIEKIFPYIKRYKNEIDPIIKNNITLISKIINFTKIDIKIIYFVLLCNIDHYFQNFIHFLGEKSANEAYKIICQILEISLKDFINAIQKRPLCLILKFDSKPWNFRDKIYGMFEINKDFFVRLLIPHQDPQEFLSFAFKRVESGNLLLNDFDHIPELDLVQKYLATALNEKEKGVNILIYGPPGTGKTEFTKSLAQQFNVTLFEVPIFDDSGEPISSERRLTSLGFAQFLLKKSKEKSMIMLDEAEDILKENKNFDRNYIAKIHLNEFLESNEIPTIWIVNSLEKIHPAHLRRFDIVIPFSRIPFEKRLKIVRKYTSSLNVDENWREALAREDIPPAIIARAAKVVSKVNSSNPEKDLEMLLKNTLQVMGKHLQLRTNREQMPYLPEILNTDPPAELLSRIAKKNHPVRMLFYGPPGTGKTALAKHFADWTGRPIVIKHGNDLLSPWVGETEHHIAKAFEEAERQEAILLIDEIDTFLRSRNLAIRSWEISHTNQFLTMMESYRGWFICTTNFLESLDQASLRRFDFRVNFKPLMPEQAWRLFQELFHEEADERHRERLSRLSLTPGNFATVWHRLRLIDQHRNPDLFLHELEKEQQVTRGEKRLRVGFTAN